MGNGGMAGSPSSIREYSPNYPKLEGSLQDHSGLNFLNILTIKITAKKINKILIILSKYLI